MNLRRQLLDRFEGGWIDFEIESRREADGSQHAQIVFGETALGIANGTDDSSLQVGLAAYEIQNLVKRTSSG